MCEREGDATGQVLLVDPTERCQDQSQVLRRRIRTPQALIRIGHEPAQRDPSCVILEARLGPPGVQPVPGTEWSRPSGRLARRSKPRAAQALLPRDASQGKQAEELAIENRLVRPEKACFHRPSVAGQRRFVSVCQVGETAEVVVTGDVVRMPLHEPLEVCQGVGDIASKKSHRRPNSESIPIAYSLRPTQSLTESRER